MRWPWSERAAGRPAVPNPHASLHCDEWVEEPGRIRELIHELAQQQPDFTLLGRGQLPLQARLDANGVSDKRLHLHALHRVDELCEPVTAMTRVNGIDLIFSSRVHTIGQGAWTLELPEDLIYLNMRRLFRAASISGESLTLDMGPKLRIKSALVNLSEAGACMAMSEPAAAQFCASVDPVAGQIDMPDLSIQVQTIAVRHVQHTPEGIQVGVSFQLPEGAECQRLRQALHRRQVEELQKKKSTCAFQN